MPIKFKIIWPDEKFLSESQIEIMYSDAIANKDIDDSEIPANISIAGKAVALDDCGLITLAKKWKYE